MNQRWSDPIDKEPAVPLTKVLRIALLVAAAATVILSLASPVIGLMIGFGSMFAMGLGTIIALSVAMSCSIVRDRSIQPKRMFSGVLASLANIAFILLVIVSSRWFVFPEVLRVFWGFSSIWAVLMAVTGLLALPSPRAAWWQKLRKITVISVYILAAALALGLTVHPEFSPLWSLFGFGYEYEAEEMLARFGWGLVLLVGGLVATTFLTMWLTPPLLEEGVRLTLWLRCPRCDCEHNRQTGDKSCTHCGLRIRVLVQ